MSSFEPLTTLIARGTLPAEEVVRLGREIAEAVNVMGVHGELWPSAILIDAQGNVDVMPAGAEDRARYGYYAAPERILGKLATYESDVFSLGAILFHALAGRPPFRGDTPAQVQMAICTDSPMDLPADVPRELAAIVMRCLSREPSARYSTPAVLRDAFDSLTSRKEFAGRRVLVADDEQDIRDAYARVASRLGIDVDIVASGREAIAAMKTRRYDLALLDLNMPRLSGWEVLDFLRSRNEMRPRRLFIVTGFSDQRVSEADRELVNAVIYKPVAPDELRTLLTECMGDGELNLRTVLRTTKHLDYGSRSAFA